MITKGKTIISEDYLLCDTHVRKFRGLMFSKKRDLLFIMNKEQRISLHMIFVFFPIWAIFCNKHRKVVAVRKLIPFVGGAFPKEPAKYVIELINKPNVKVGDKLEF